MGGRQVGRSEPAFRVTSTTALPPPTCTTWREAGRRRLLAVVLLRGLYRPDRLQQLCFKACAGRIVRRLCLPAAASLSRLRVPATFAMPCPLPLFTSPHSILLCPHLFISMRAGIVQVVRTVLLAATTRACSGGPCASSPVTFTLFPAESIDPGPWVSVNYKAKLYCTNECAPGMSVLAPAILFKLSE